MRQDARKQPKKREKKKAPVRDTNGLIYMVPGKVRQEIRATERQLAWMANHDWVMP